MKIDSCLSGIISSHIRCSFSESGDAKSGDETQSDCRALDVELLKAFDGWILSSTESFGFQRIVPHRRTHSILVPNATGSRVRLQH